MKDAGKRNAQDSIYGAATGRWLTNAPTKQDWIKHDTRTGVYIGPASEGGDAEYVKVISGPVHSKKPSFAR